jgi:hypothetical protein
MLHEKMTREEVYKNGDLIIERIADVIFNPKYDTEDSDYAVQLFFEYIINFQDSYTKDDLKLALYSLWNKY